MALIDLMVHGADFIRVTFDDGSTVDVKYHVRGWANGLGKAARAAHDRARVRRAAVQARVAGSKDAKEFQSILDTAEGLRGRIGELVGRVRSGASDLCDWWRSDAALVNDPDPKAGEWGTEAEQSRYAQKELLTLCRAINRCVDLFDNLPISASLESGGFVLGERSGGKLSNATTYYPPGAKVPPMKSWVQVSPTQTRLMTEKEIAAREAAAEKKRDRATGRKNLLWKARHFAHKAAAAERQSKKFAGYAGRARAMAEKTAKPKQPSHKAPLPAAVADRMKSVEPSKNGHAKAVPNGKH